MSAWGTADWLTAWNWWTMPVTVIGDVRTEDLERLAAIHAACFPGAPWGSAELAGLLRQDTVIGLVVRRANFFGTRTPVAFVLARLVAGEAEILTIAVDPVHRRRGFARQLMENLLRRLYHDRAETLFLEVDAGNEAALSLYRRLRFRRVGERKGYYAHGTVPGATALVMRTDLR
ncbi:MAG: GNAT family N-acetyltransferase [Siculibacillus sp.]|nr:GNAT family N-acetyltransferase [Siculibacillus sp.]